MLGKQRSTVGRHLAWVLLEGTLLVPIVLVGFGGFTTYPWGVQALALILGVCVAYPLAWDLVHLWRAPATEADAGSVARLVAVGAWFALAAAGPLIEGSAQAKPSGVVSAILAVNLWVLAARDMARVSNRRAQEPSTPQHSGVNQ